MLAYGFTLCPYRVPTGLEGMPGVEPVTQEQVFGFFEQNVHRIRDLLAAAIPLL